MIRWQWHYKSTEKILMKFYTFSQCGQIVPNQGHEPGVMIFTI